MTTPTGSRRRISKSPWSGIEDACSNAARLLGDPTAMDGMNAAATAHQVITALGKALSAVGKTAVDNIAIDPRVAAYMEGLGQYVLKAAQPTEEMGFAITRAHQAKIDRIIEGSPKERKWDIGAHDSGGGGPQRRPA